jgi:hypothetical protein
MRGSYWDSGRRALAIGNPMWPSKNEAGGQLPDRPFIHLSALSLRA